MPYLDLSLKLSSYKPNLSTGPGSSAITDILIESFELDESSGNRTGAHAGTVLTDNNTVTSNTGHVNAVAASFDETNDEYLSLANASASDFAPGTSDYAIEAWFFAESGGGGVFQYIFGFGADAVGGSGDGISLAYEGGLHRMRISIDDGTNNPATSSPGGILQDEWHHVIVNLDRSANCDVYVDGSSILTFDISSVSGSDIQPTYDLHIGGRSYSTTTLQFNGLLGPVRVYSDILDSSMRTFLYNSGSGRTYSELFSYTP